MTAESTASREIRARIRAMIRKRCQIADAEDFLVRLQDELETAADRVAALVVDDIEVEELNPAETCFIGSQGEIDSIHVRIPESVKEKPFVVCGNNQFAKLIEAAIIAEMVKGGMLEPDMEG